MTIFQRRASPKRRAIHALRWKILHLQVAGAVVGSRIGQGLGLMRPAWSRSRSCAAGLVMGLGRGRPVWSWSRSATRVGAHSVGDGRGSRLESRELREVGDGLPRRSAGGAKEGVASHTCEPAAAPHDRDLFSRGLGRGQPAWSRSQSRSCVSPTETEPVTGTRLRAFVKACDASAGQARLAAQASYSLRGRQACLAVAHQAFTGGRRRKVGGTVPG